MYGRWKRGCSAASRTSHGDVVELLARHAGVRRSDDLLDPRQPGRSERGHVALEHRLERLGRLPLRVLAGERPDAVEGERELDVERLLRPERPVVVEDGEALAGGTWSGPASSVTASTNARMARFASPSFQDGSGSGVLMASMSRPACASASPDPDGWPARAGIGPATTIDAASFQGETDGEPAHHPARARRRPVSIARGRLGLGGPMDRRAHLRRCLPGAREGERRGADALPLRPRRGRLRRPRRAGAGRGGRHDRLARDERLAGRARDRRDRDEQGRHRRGRRASASRWSTPTTPAARR